MRFATLLPACAVLSLNAAAPNGMIVRVMDRVWNGDQADYDLNLTARPVWLKVTMGRYR